MKESVEELQEEALGERAAAGGVRRRQIALAIGLTVALYLGVGVFDHGIWAPTEPTVAGIVWNMDAHGGLAVPRVNDSPYLEKPPLYYWLALGACKAGGSLSAGLIRLPAALMGIVCLLLVWRTARRQYGERAACLALLAGATLTTFWEYSHRASTDIAATFFCFVCFAIFAETIERSGPGAGAAPAGRGTLPRVEPGAARSGTRRWDIALALALAASFYSKNFYTYLIVCPPVLLFLAHKREFRRIARIGAWLAAFTALLLLPWCLALHREGGWEYLRVVFVDNTAGRFFHLIPPPSAKANVLNDAYWTGRKHGALFYPATLGMFVREWALLFLAGCLCLARRWRRGNDFDRFLVIGVVALPAALMVSSSKSAEYLTPVLFFVMLMLAGALADLIEAGTAGRWEKRLAAANVALLAGAACVLPAATAVLTGRLLPLAWAPACAGFVLFWAARRRRGARGIKGWGDFTFLHACFCFLAATLAVGIGFLMPYADVRKTTAPFFEAVRKESAGAELYTTCWDDRHLPLINYSLRRRVKVLEPVVSYYRERRIAVENEEAVFRLLASGRKVGIITSREFCEANRQRLAALLHTEIPEAEGKEAFGYLGSAAGSALDAPK